MITWQVAFQHVAKVHQGVEAEAPHHAQMQQTGQLARAQGLALQQPGGQGSAQARGQLFQRQFALATHDNAPHIAQTRQRRCSREQGQQQKKQLFARRQHRIFSRAKRGQCTTIRAPALDSPAPDEYTADAKSLGQGCKDGD